MMNPIGSAEENKKEIICAENERRTQNIAAGNKA